MLSHSKKIATVLFLLIGVFASPEDALAEQVVLYESYEDGGAITIDNSNPNDWYLIGSFQVPYPLLFNSLADVFIGANLTADSGTCNVQAYIASSTDPIVYGSMGELWNSTLFTFSTAGGFQTESYNSGGDNWLVAGWDYGIYVRDTCTEIFTVEADTNDLIYYGYLSWDGDYGEQFGEISGETRIISVEPEDMEVVASTTDFTVGGEIYVSAEDFVDDLRFRQKISKTQSPLNYVTFGRVTFPILNVRFIPWITEFFDDGVSYEITGSGTTSYSTTTDISTEGLYTLTTYIETPRTLSSVFGYTVLVEGKTHFVVGTTTKADRLILGIGEALDDMENGTTTFSQMMESCNPLSGFNMTECAKGLFYLPEGSAEELYGDTHDQVLTRFPVGYATRLVDLFNSEATSTIPVLSFTIQNEGILQSFAGDYSFDFATYISDASDILNDDLSTNAGIVETDEDQNLWDVIMPWLTILGYLGLVIKIIQEVMGLDFRRGSGQIGRTTGGVTDDEYRYKETLYRLSQRK